MGICVFLPLAMARDHKPVELRPVDDDIGTPAPIRLNNPQTAWKNKELKAIRLGSPSEEVTVNRRLDLPSKEVAELRTHQPGIEVIIEPLPPTPPDGLEQNWGDSATRQLHPARLQQSQQPVL